MEKKVISLLADAMKLQDSVATLEDDVNVIPTEESALNDTATALNDAYWFLDSAIDKLKDARKWAEEYDIYERKGE